MRLDTEVNIGAGDVVLDGVAASQRGAHPPVFGSCLLWPNGWMVEDTTGYCQSTATSEIVKRDVLVRRVSCAI